MAGEPYVITEACLDVKDRACVDVCPVQCIYELVDGELIAKDAADGEIENRQKPHPDLQYIYGDRLLYIHPDECTSCTACMPVCPVDAIYPADKVPENLHDFIDINRFMFAETSET